MHRRRPIAVFASYVLLSGLAALLAAASSATGRGEDVLVQYFSKTVSTGGPTIGGFAYDAPNDRFLVAGFSGAGQAIRTITSTSGRLDTITYNTGTGFYLATGTSTASGLSLLEETDWISYARSTSLTDNGGSGTTHLADGWDGQPIPGNIKLNPASLTVAGITYAPGTLAVLNDAMNIRSSTSPSVFQPAHSKVAYTFDLRETGNGTVNTGRDRNGDGEVDWNDPVDTVVTRGDFQTKLGLPATSNSFNLVRSFAFSSDGKSMYLNEAGTTYGGIWKIDLESTGPTALTRIVTNTTAPLAATDPTVVTTAQFDYDPADSMTGDQILFETSAINGDTSNTQAGIGYVIHNGTTTSAPKTLLSSTDLRAFLETSASSVGSITSDSSGNLYFFEAEGNGVYLRDTQGRLVKLASVTQRTDFQKAVTGGTSINVNALDLQTRTVTVTIDGNTFTVPEVLYSDSVLASPIGILAFKPGDFNRDNSLTSADLTQFQGALGLRGVAATAANRKFDMNGNNTVDWKDVKILQQFAGFNDGDADMDGSVNFTDLNTMRDNYYTVSGQTLEKWTTGDFASSDPAYPAAAPDANRVNLTDLGVIAGTWLNVLFKPQITWDELDINSYSGQFRTDVISAFGIDFLGDMDGNGTLNNFDIQVFELALTRPEDYLALFPTRASDFEARGNVNGIGGFDNFDIEAFEDLLTSSAIAGSAAVPEPSTAVLLAAGLCGLVVLRRRGATAKRNMAADAARQE